MDDMKGEETIRWGWTGGRAVERSAKDHGGRGKREGREHSSDGSEITEDDMAWGRRRIGWGTGSGGKEEGRWTPRDTDEGDTGQAARLEEDADSRECGGVDTLRSDGRWRYGVDIGQKHSCLHSHDVDANAVERIEAGCEKRVPTY